jgi:O-6-methylguanine DNA methyltransferase
MDVEPLPSTKQMQVWQRLTALALRAALAGKTSSAAPPLDLSAGTPFQQKVWRALREIPLGQTRSYSEIAAAVDHPRAVRAVGGACGANPIPVLVPCHRVLAQGGKLGGFSAGLGWKERLLECEGVRLGQAARRFETAQ